MFASHLVWTLLLFCLLVFLWLLLPLLLLFGLFCFVVLFPFPSPIFLCCWGFGWWEFVVLLTWCFFHIIYSLKKKKKSCLVTFTLTNVFDNSDLSYKFNKIRLLVSLTLIGSLFVSSLPKANITIRNKSGFHVGFKLVWLEYPLLNMCK